MGSHVDDTRDVKDLFRTTWVAGVPDVLRKWRGGVVRNAFSGEEARGFANLVGGGSEQ